MQLGYKLDELQLGTTLMNLDATEMKLDAI